MANKNIQNMPFKFYCDKCDYGCSKKSCWGQHLLTAKHNKANLELIQANEKYVCEKCNINFKHQSSYCRHHKKCAMIAQYVDDNFVDRTNNLSQSINGVKTFSSFPLCSATPNSNNQLVNKKYVDDNFVDKTTGQNIGGNKTFLNNVSCNGNLTGNIILCDNYRGTTQNSTVLIGGSSTAGQIQIGTLLNSSGNITIGTSASPCTINSTTTFLNHPLTSGLT
jgi:hypothetical protein